MKEFTDTELANERWRDVEGYDGMYQVSDLGRVRSRKSGEWKVLRPKKNNSGYLQVGLFKDENNQQPLVHRLVAQAFIPNDDETKTIINHRNSIRDCNRVDNLEWCDYRYNNTYLDIQFRKKTSKRRKIEKLYRPDLTINENLKLFKEQGIECCIGTVINLRQEFNLEPHPNYKRHKLKDLYRQDLTIKQNIDLFKEQGIDCSKSTVIKLRKDLGLIK